MENVFGDKEIEAFKEAGNIGAGHAAIALTKLFAIDVDMSIPFVRYGDVKSVLDAAGIEPDMLLAYADIDIHDPVKYKLSVFFKPESIINILNLLTSLSTPKLESGDDLTQMQKSLIQEVGSTIMLRYIAALNKMMRVDSMPNNAPIIKFSSAQDAFSTLFAKGNNSNVFLIQLDLFTDEQKFECQLFIQPDPDSIDEYRKLFYLE